MPHGNPGKVTSFMLTAENLTALTQERQITDLSAGAIINRALKAYFADQKRNRPSARTIAHIARQVKREVAALQKQTPGLSFEDAIDELNRRENGSSPPPVLENETE